MNLEHITLDQLKLSGLNVRKKGGKEFADLLPSIRTLGLLQPLLVRPNCEGFEIVAGQRRFHALTRLAQEGIAEPVPCIVMAEGDDAKAIEASLVENIARLPMDEIDQYKAFAALIAKGMDSSSIASHFGVSERLVQQRLAIANIIEPILNAYRREEISAGTLRLLTMATPRQQKAWWTLLKDEDAYAPMGGQLKQWLFGGSQVPVSNALFDLAEYKDAIVSDLFGEDRFFANAQTFWPLQNAAIAQKRDAYLAAGWEEVVILDIGEHFMNWNYEKTPRTKGGKVFVTITHDGEASFHEGWLTAKDARRKEKSGDAIGEGNDETALLKSARPELTKAMQNYLGLHKHAAVRTELLAHPGIALRLSVAHIIAGSGLWSITSDRQRADNLAIAESLASSQATAGFAEERRAIRRLLGIASDESENVDADKDAEPDEVDTDINADEADDDPDEPIVPRQRGFRSAQSLEGIFTRLIAMDDKDVLRILAFVMAETLQAQSGMIETLGALFSTDMRNWWKPEETFFDLLRDKQAINAIVREVASDMTADAHIASTAKVQKKIIADCLSGDGRAKVENWLPRYMAFPAQGYTERFGGQASTLESDQPETEGNDDIADAA